MFGLNKLASSAKEVVREVVHSGGVTHSSGGVVHSSSGVVHSGGVVHSSGGVVHSGGVSYEEHRTGGGY